MKCHKCQADVLQQFKFCQAYVGLIKINKAELKPIKGKTMLVRVPVNVRKLDLLEKSVEKHAAHDRNFDRYESYALLYPDGTEVLTLPGNPTQLFQLNKYKEDIEKPYNRIAFYLVERYVIDQSKGDSSDSSDETDMTRSAFINDNSKKVEKTSNTPGAIVIKDDTKEDIKSIPTDDVRKDSSFTIQHSPYRHNSAVCTREDHSYRQLKEMFPNNEERELKDALDSTASLEDAINVVLNANTPSINDAYASLFNYDIGADDNVDDGDLLNIYSSADVARAGETSTFATDSNLQDKLNKHKEAELSSSGEFLRIKVRRQAVWEDTRIKFIRVQDEDLRKPVKVQFIGEPAVDNGGPSREFFTLMNAAAYSKLMCDGIFRHSISSLDKREFYLYGQITALGLMQGFPGPKCFNKTVVDYILTGDIGQLHPDVEDIPDPDVKQSLKSLMAITDEAEFKTQATFNSDFRFDAGYSKPFVHILDKEELCRCVALHHVILASMAETNQFVEVLKTANMLNLLRENPELFRKVFQVQKALTAEMVDDIFEVEYSPVDSNKFAIEQKIVFNLTQYLEDVEKGMITTKLDGKEVVVTLKHVLQFITGAEDIPAIGFTPRPKVRFCHETNPQLVRKLTANTCANILTLPVFGMSEYTKFSQELTFCLMNSPGFGVI